MPLLIWIVSGITFFILTLVGISFIGNDIKKIPMALTGSIGLWGVIGILFLMTAPVSLAAWTISGMGLHTLMIGVAGPENTSSNDEFMRELMIRLGVWFMLGLAISFVAL